MKKKLMLILLLSFSLFMFGYSSNGKLNQEIVNMLETSTFTVSKTDQFGRTVKKLYKSGYSFTEIRSPKEYNIRIQKLSSDGYTTQMLYDDGKSSEYSGWAKWASKEDKQAIKDILGIN